MSGRVQMQNKTFLLCDKMVEQMPSFINDWYLYLRASNKSALTCKDYLVKIRKYLKFIDEDCNVELSDINHSTLMKFFISIQTKNVRGEDVSVSDSYKCGVHAGLSSLTNFLFKTGKIDADYMQLIDKPKNRDLERINENRIHLDEWDYKRILNTVRSGYKGQKYSDILGRLKSRDLVIFLFLMYTGIRESALVSIDVSDIDLENNSFTVIDKGEKRRTCNLPDNIIDELEVWLIDREDLLNILGKKTDALFINQFGDRLASRAIYKMVGKYSEEALGEKLTPHKFRAGFCSILYNETRDLEFVRRAVGHSSVSTTQRYIVTEGDEAERAVSIMNEKIDWQ